MVLSFVIFLLAAIVMLLIRQAQLATGVDRPTQNALTTQPDFVGWVLGVDPVHDQIKVESQADKLVRPVIVKVTKDTLIFRREEDVLRQVDISELHLQDQAELWLIGPVPSSFPAEVNVRQMIVEKLY